MRVGAVSIAVFALLLTASNALWAPRGAFPSRCASVT